MLIEPEPETDWSFIQEIIRPSTTSPAYGPAIISLPRILQKESEILMKIDPDSNPTHYITGDFVGGMREKPTQIKPQKCGGGILPYSTSNWERQPLSVERNKGRSIHCKRK